MYPTQSNTPTHPDLPPPPQEDALAHYQPIRVAQGKPVQPPKSPRPRARRPGCAGCLGILAAALFGPLLVLAVFFFLPYPTRMVLLGVDRAADGSYTGRTDTIMFIQVNPLKPDVSMLSIPRDLWVPIEGVGENRINTAHFFAEANQPGSGPQAVLQVIRYNFGLRANYYARVRFDGFKEVIDALGGIDLNLAEDQGGLPAGKHHLNGEEALAFARDRKGTDDFFRMNQGQTVILATARQVLNPLTWPRLPAAITTFFSVVETNLPIWEWPRLGLAFIRAGSSGIDHRTITREMVIPFTTDGGAQVLLPNWDAINPMLDELFKR
ncbi:MAG: LCP family protein [Anaerolineae bacterium]|nr:LCP family protein [Anaerolineae bacterium]